MKKNIKKNCRKKATRTASLCLAVLMSCYLCTVTTGAMVTDESVTAAVTKSVNLQKTSEEMAVTGQATQSAGIMDNNTTVVEDKTVTDVSEQKRTDGLHTYTIEAQQDIEKTQSDNNAVQTEEDIAEQKAAEAQTEEPASDTAVTITSGNYVYTVNSDKTAATITKYMGKEAKVIIPSEIDGIEVVELASKAFSGDTALTEVVIPSTVKEGHVYCDFLTESDGPFFGTSLKKATIEAGSIAVPQFIFAGADKLDTVVIPDTITSVGDGAFLKCTSLKSISIPDNAEKIGDAAFSGCTALASVHLSDNLRELGRQSFKGCTALTTVTIPASLEKAHVYCDFTSESDGPFVNSGLINVSFEKGTAKIVQFLFAGADKLTSITIPSTVKQIDEGAFIKCTGLKSVTIPDKVTIIDEAAFSECANISSVKLSDTIKELGKNAFYKCTSLKSINIPASLEKTHVYCDFTGYTDGPFNASGISSVTFGSGMVKIPQFLFAGAVNLTQINIPSSVTAIEKGAFTGSGLKSVTISDNVTAIGISAFEKCTSLSNVKLGKKLTTISNALFAECTQLGSVTIPDAVTGIGKNAFTGAGLTQITLPDNIEKIGENAFSNCKQLEKVTLGQHINTIEYRTFYNCIKLNNVELHGGLRTIKEEAFALCNKITDITIPVSVKTIEDNVFSYPAKMTITGVNGSYAQQYAKDNDIEFVGKTVKATAVKLDKSTLNIEYAYGGSAKLKATVTPVDYTDELKWISSDSSIAEVDENGLVKAHKKGTVVITCKAGSVSAGCTVTVGKVEALAVTMTAQQTSKNVTFTAKASGGSNSGYQYKFIVYNKTTGKWGKVQDFSSKNTCTWNKSSAGEREFYVDVKDSTGKVSRSKVVNITIGSAKPQVSVKVNTNQVVVGGNVSFTVNATGGSGGYTYKFIVYNPQTKQWGKVQDFGTKNTCTWKAGSAGTRQFYVDVKDSKGNVTRSAVCNVNVIKAGTALSVKASASTANNKVGGNVSITAGASGGSGKYTYKFIVYNTQTKQWAKLRDFSSLNTLSWKAASAGVRQFYVDVKDSTGKVVRSSVMTVTTKK